MTPSSTLRFSPLVRPGRRPVTRCLVIETLEDRTLLSATPTTVFVANSSQQISFQQSETFTATVGTSAFGTPPTAGTVTFLDGSTPLGVASVSSGVATFTTSALGVGTHLITASYSGTANYAASVSGTAATIVPGAGLERPRAVAVDAAGDVFIADTSNNRVVMVTPAGSQFVVASGLNDPSGVAVNSLGDVFIADTGNSRVLEVTPTGNETTVGTGLTEPMGVAVDSTGDVFIADSGNDRVVEVTSAGAQSTFASGLADPNAVAVDAAGDVFIADTNNSQVVEVPSGVTPTPYVTGLRYPTGVSVNSVGDLFIAVSSLPGTLNTNQVLMVNPSKMQTPVGFGLGEPTGVAVDGAGDVFIADTSNNQVLEESPGLPVRVNAATPTITWAKPADISYDTPLGPTQLDASASVPGTFAYSPRLGTIFPAGADQTIIVTFTPADATDYTTATANVSINVNQATATLSWPMPADIELGTPLGSTQLDATANVPGTFSYTPAAGTMLPAGQSEVLSVTFTPDNLADYTAVSATTTITVKSSPPVITGAQALFTRKLKHGKPTGHTVLTGYTIDFSGKLNPSTAELAANYQVEVESVKNVKKRKVTSLQPLTGFTASYNDATDSVSLLFTGQPTFNSGGQITILGGPSIGVTDTSGAFVSGSRVLTIAPGGRTVALN